MALPADLASLDPFIDMLVDDLVREILAEGAGKKESAAARETDTGTSSAAGPARAPDAEGNQ